MLEWAAGFPTPRRLFHSPPRPASEKMERSFPTRLSTAPAANREGQGQRVFFWEPKEAEEEEWILVLPSLSFHAKNIETSLGAAASRDLGVGREPRKISSSFWRLAFYFSYGLEDLSCWRELRRLSNAGRSSWTTLSVVVTELLRLYPHCWQKDKDSSCG